MNCFSFDIVFSYKSLNEKYREKLLLGFLVTPASACTGTGVSTASNTETTDDIGFLLYVLFLFFLHVTSVIILITLSRSAWVLAKMRNHFLVLALTAVLVIISMSLSVIQPDPIMNNFLFSGIAM
jgi:hypothetical protein